MNASELPGGMEKSSGQSEESAAERIKKIEEGIGREAAKGNFDEVLRLSLKREEAKHDAHKISTEQARREALPAKLRQEIEGARERIAEIEDGSFFVEPNLKATILTNITDRLHRAEEDLLIAEGAKPGYEEQSEELRTHIENLIEQYARRYEELVHSGDTPRINAFLEDTRGVPLNLPHESAYEGALRHARTDFAMRTEYDLEPRENRNRLVSIKVELEETLRRSAE